MEIPVRIGEVVAGKYRVERLIGEGGMGVVVAAHDVELDRPVALKLMRPELAGDGEGVARFVREARAAVKLTSQHVARVFEVGATDQSGTPFIAMEFLDGTDLEAILRERGPLPVEEAVDYVLQACDAIAEAHAVGIVHRDLKPQNLFLAKRPTGNPVIKVLDFGISKMVRPGAGPTTDLKLTQSAVGSPLYMAPEQMLTRPTDARTDVWSLGVVLFELLTGRTPFGARSVMELAIVVAQDPAPLPEHLRPEVPEGLSRIVLRCLEKAPDARWPSVATLAAELKRFAPRSRSGRPDAFATTAPMPDAAQEGARTVARASPTPVALAGTSVSWPDGDARRLRRLGRIVALTAGAVVAAGIVYAFSRRAPPPHDVVESAPVVSGSLAPPRGTASIAWTLSPVESAPPLAALAPIAPALRDDAGAARTAGPVASAPRPATSPRASIAPAPDPLSKRTW